MKTIKFTKLFSLLMALFALSISGYSQTYNYFVGSDFEDSALNDIYWLPFQEGTNATASFSYETTNPIAGSQSYKVKINSKTATAAVWMVQVTQFATCHKGVPVTLRFKAKADQAGTFDVEWCQEYAPFANSIYGSTVSVGTEVATYTFTGIPAWSEGTYKMDFLLGTMPAGSTLWLDDVELVQDTPWDQNKMPNGEFDEYDVRDNGPYLLNYFSGWDGGFIDTVNGVNMVLNIDTNSVLSGKNSMHVNLINNSANWWEGQATAFYIGYPGEYYECSFLTKGVGSDTWFSLFDDGGAEANNIINTQVTVPVGKKKHRILSNIPVATRTDRLLHFFFGNIPSGSEFYIDSVVARRVLNYVSLTGFNIDGRDKIAKGKKAAQYSVSAPSPANATFPEAVWSVLGGDNTVSISESGVLSVSGASALTTVTVQGAALYNEGVVVTKVVSIVNNISVSGISVSGVTLVSSTLTPTYTANVYPDYADNTAVVWSVTTVDGTATISGAGKLTPGSDGAITITATAADGYGATGSLNATITSSIVLVSGITITGASVVTIGGTSQLSATVLPLDATNSAVTWSVSSSSIATIDVNGLLTPVAAGVVTVTAIATDGSEVWATKVITVQAVTAVTTATDDKTFTIYPNPSEGGKFTIDLGSNTIGTEVAVSVIDLQGQTLYSKIAKGESKLSVETGVQPGFYLVLVKYDGKTQVHKLLVK